MVKYKDFKEYMEENFYDDIFNRIKSFVARQRDSFESDEIYNVKWVEVDDIHVSGVTFKEMEGCQTAHCGRGKSHFIFGGLASPMVPYRNFPQAPDGMTADCRSFV